MRSMNTETSGLISNNIHTPQTTGVVGGQGKRKAPKTSEVDGAFRALEIFSYDLETVKSSHGNQHTRDMYSSICITWTEKSGLIFLVWFFLACMDFLPGVPIQVIWSGSIV